MKGETGFLRACFSAALGAISVRLRKPQRQRLKRFFRGAAAAKKGTAASARCSSSARPTAVPESTEPPLAGVPCAQDASSTNRAEGRRAEGWDAGKWFGSVFLGGGIPVFGGFVKGNKPSRKTTCCVGFFGAGGSPTKDAPQWLPGFREAVG